MAVSLWASSVMGDLALPPLTRMQNYVRTREKRILALWKDGEEEGRKSLLGALTNLQRGYDIISQSTRWSQGEWARSRNRRVLEPGDNRAWSFCSAGVIKHVDGPYEGATEDLLNLAILYRTGYADGIISVNDNASNKEQLLNYWRLAIAMGLYLYEYWHGTVPVWNPAGNWFELEIAVDDEED